MEENVSWILTWVINTEIVVINRQITHIHTFIYSTLLWLYLPIVSVLPYCTTLFLRCFFIALLLKNDIKIHIYNSYRMDLYFRNGTKYHLLYNCTFYNTSAIPIEKRINIPLGIIILIVSSTQLVSLVRIEILCLK